MVCSKVTGYCFTTDTLSTVQNQIRQLEENKNEVFNTILLVVLILFLLFLVIIGIIKIIMYKKFIKTTGREVEERKFAYEIKETLKKENGETEFNDEDERSSLKK
jgi:cytochrome c oxidase assembly protein Cox11